MLGLEEMLKLYRSILAAADIGWEAKIDIVALADKILTGDLLNEFRTRPKAYITDALLLRHTGKPCMLFEANWLSTIEAAQQLRDAGFSPLEARRNSMKPIADLAEDPEDAQLILAMTEGLLLKEPIVESAKPESLESAVMKMGNLSAS